MHVTHLLVRTQLALLLCSAVLVTACARGLPDFAGLTEDVSPVVVNISTTSSAPAPAGGARADFFQRFFGMPGGSNPWAPGSSFPRMATS